MADSEARREARRRKILENADKRMKRLTNQYESEKEVIENKTDEDKLTNTSANAIKEENLAAKTTAPELNLKATGPEVQTKSEQQSAVQQQNIQSELRHRGTVKIQRNIDSHNIQTQDSQKSVVKPEKSETDINLTLKQTEGLKIASLILLAIVCRLVLKCGFGLFYFQSIFLPFVALEIGWIHYQLRNSLQMPRKKNKMSTMLMLCGIKPDLLVVYDTIMSYVTTFSEDSGLFIFSFFISNLLVS
ncbi:uncharacterized protein LOC127708497 [Mytilus californianus]|uniref:uncharacterized protein LOC127708497 n=1 Tax=Mytilus californianus TaxID=6549 RepID=UPI0022469BDF|nr:uncharacterized protein LOC127708497 [Mytilus californianus]